jgi:glycosyltransferase involved in cell wall biosynthesis
MKSKISQTPQVSVIIPAFNAAAFLGRSIESVLLQTYSYYELIVINDGSTDNTTEVIRQFSREIVAGCQENLGPSAARNLGVRLAKGQLIAFLDADDYWLPDFLSSCVDFLNRHPEISAVNTGQKIITGTGEDIINPPILRSKTESSAERILTDFFRFWAEQDHIRTGSCLIRKQVLDQAGPMREDLPIGEDLEYWGYLATFGRWGFIPQILWVCDSALCSAAQGWLAKYRKRGQVCPTIENWQRRIVQNLRSNDLEGFRIVRGRVAQTFAYIKLLGGDVRGARDITRRYGQDFPVNPVSRLLRLIAPKGTTVWSAISMVLLFREACKGWRLNRSPHKILGGYKAASQCSKA